MARSVTKATPTTLACSLPISTRKPYQNRVQDLYRTAWILGIPLDSWIDGRSPQSVDAASWTLIHVVGRVLVWTPGKSHQCDLPI